MPQVIDTPRLSRTVREEIEQLAEEAKASVCRAEKENRLLTVAEDTRFNEICDVLIPQLKREQAAAVSYEDLLRSGGGPDDAIYPHFDARNSLNRGESMPTTFRNGRNPREQEMQGLLDGREQNDRQPRVMYRTGRLRCFNDPCDAYDAGMYLRAILARIEDRDDKAAFDHCHRIGWQITNIGTEGTGPAGGYLVPAPLSNTIIDVREAVGVARRIMRTTPMTSDTLTVPKRNGGLTVYYPGEGGSITTSDKDWKQVQLIARKRAVANQISQELVDDALLNIVDNCVEEMAYALADQEDNEVINGTGASTYGGVRGLLNMLGAGGVSTAATGHDTWGELDLADMTAAMGLLPDRYHARMPVWVCSAAFYFNVMLRIQAAAGGNTLVSLQAGDGGVKSFLGYPVYLTQYMPKSTAASTVAALFGAFDAGCLLGERIGVRIARSDDYAFLNDLTTLRATTRYDFQVHDPGTASVAGAFIGLKTAA